MPRLARLLRMVHLLRESDPLSVEDLAERLDVSRRTIFRDLTTLRQAGAVVTHDAERGYHIDRLTLGSQAHFQASEVLALSMLHRYLASARHDPILGAAAKPIAELLASADDSLREACDQLGQSILMADDHPPSPPDRSLVLDALRAAETGQAVEVTLVAPSGESGDARCSLHEIGLERRAGCWLLIGRAPEGGEAVRLRFDEIVAIRVQDRPLRSAPAPTHPEPSPARDAQVPDVMSRLIE